MSEENGVPLENFIQALTSQLDRAQTMMALKARAGMPLTFAVKDLKLDLRTHVDVVRNAVHIRPAAPRDAEASTLHLELTTITRPMMEENTLQAVAESSEPSIEDFYKQNVGQEISEEDARRLEWAGIHTISQLRQLERSGNAGVLRRVGGTTPVERLRQALMKADSPRIDAVLPEPRNGPGGIRRQLMRIRGEKLMQEGAPHLAVDGEPARIVEARPHEILFEPARPTRAGTISIKTAPGLELAQAFALEDVQEEDGDG